MIIYQFLAARKKWGPRVWIWAIVAALLVWWWLNQPREQGHRPERRGSTSKKEPPEWGEEIALEKQQDDFTKVEGIGPKINELLHESGITTYAQLAAAGVPRLRDLMRASRLYMVSPTHWPQQAQLAADGQWDRLEALKTDLKAGRNRE
jgi:predicted flap endonuclease-1-like 5' DNA nuclease